MNAIERVQCVLDGRTPDRPPVSFWCHFPPDQVYGPAAADVHMAYLETYDLDFLKVMNDNGYPHTERIVDVQGLAALTELRGDEPAFARQLDLLADLKRRIGDRLLMNTTVFNAWATLRHLVREPGVIGPPNMDPSADAPSATLRDFYRQDPDAVESALMAIGASLGNFVRRCIEAGADGVFLSVRDDWLDAGQAGPGLYDRLVRPSDLRILAGAAAGRFNILHVCGGAVGFRAFAQYPVHAINWADRLAGPAIADVIGWAKPAVCGGVENLKTLPDGTPEDCEREVRDAIRQAGDRPILIAPGCTYDPARVPKANLEAVCRAVRR
jgi:uroporphyrinogen decarboxylase